MNKPRFDRRMAVAALALTMWILPVAAIAQQTQITAPKNKYRVQDDIRLGNQASSEVERQFPLINDADAAAYIERIGQRLVAAIPPQFAHSEFNYRFKWVDASDINAFALPGGAMYINRGMIEAAKNEGELAGVMAHELSHVALRHATAQATKQSSFGNQARTIGLILGGAILGGESGAQLGQVFAAGYSLKYSREYESQADALGAEIMANAGYDPHDLANVFRTLAQQDHGGGTPQWLSSHPDSASRYEAINREAATLKISPNPIKMTRDFERIQARFRAMPRARSMAQIQRDYQNGRVTYNPSSNGTYNPSSGGTYDPAANGRYNNSVQSPSTRMRSYSGVSGMTMSVPSNWQDFNGQDGIKFAPEGAYGDQGITHGVLLGVYRGQTGDLARGSEAYLDQMLQSNSYLRQRGGFSLTTVGGRSANTIVLSGRSPVTNRTEIVTVYTIRLRTGDIMYIDTVVPGDESRDYSYAFRSMLDSVRINN